MHKRTNITGAILAGGRSSRMGRDKALLDLDGRPFIEHIANTLRAVFEHVIIVSGHKSEYEFLMMPIYQDLYKDCGPLAGIYTALVKANNAATFIASCDIPFLSTSFIHYVIERDRHNDVTVVLGGNSLEPLCGLYKKSCIPIIKKQLQEGEYAVRACLKKLHTTILSPPIDAPRNRVHPLMNINTPRDYERCVLLAAEQKHTATRH
jgi:molybdopterin-guanine dinucleotide biosynthesis protein A